MKVEKMIGERFKERPSDCAVESHALMVRGGYMKQVANGIYSETHFTEDRADHPGGDGCARRAGGVDAGGAAGQPLAGVRAL